MAPKIINVFSDPVFFNVNKLWDWNLPNIIRYGMLRIWGKCILKWEKNKLWWPWWFSAVLAWRGYHTGDFSQRDTVVEARSYSLRCILVQGNYGAASCVGRQKAAGLIGILVRSSLFTEEARLCGEETGFFSRIMLQFTRLVGRTIFSMLITFIFRIIHRGL